MCSCAFFSTACGSEINAAGADKIGKLTIGKRFSFSRCFHYIQPIKIILRTEGIL